MSQPADTGAESNTQPAEPLAPAPAPPASPPQDGVDNVLHRFAANAFVNRPPTTTTEDANNNDDDDDDDDENAMPQNEGFGLAMQASMFYACSDSPSESRTQTADTAETRDLTTGGSSRNNAPEEKEDTRNTRLLSAKDNFRITKDELDEAFKWLTAKCRNGKITDRHLKEQLFSVFGNSPRWTRKEFNLLASDSEMTADKLWNTVLPRHSTCESFDAVAEAFAAFDEDGDGFADTNILRSMWVELYKENPSGQPLPEDHATKICPAVHRMYLDIVDGDGDGQISLDDFRAYAKKKKPPL